MENQKYKEMLSQSGSCPSSELLWEYAHGEAEQGSLKELENHLAHCVLCAGAVEGFATMNSPMSLHKVSAKNPYASAGNFLGIAKVMLVLSGIIAILWWWSSKENRSALVDDSRREVSIESPNDMMESDSKGEEEAVDSVMVIDSTGFNGPAVNVSVNNTSDRWKDELFVIEKRGIKLANRNQVKLEIADRSLTPIIYIHDLKVMDFTKKYAITNQFFELPSNLHPRYANPNEKGSEQIYTDVDTIYYRDLLSSAIENFSRGYYKQSVEQLLVILKRYPSDDNALFYGGLAKAELNEWKGAIVLLKKLSVQSKSAFYEEANWHLALTYLKSDDVKEGQEKLLKIAEGNGFYSSQAKELLKK